MDLLIAAGVPSAITAFCFWLIERKIQARAEAEKEERLNRQREQDAKEENREKLQYMTVKWFDGCWMHNIRSMRSYGEYLRRIRGKSP